MRRRLRVEEETGELNIVPYLDVVVNLVMFMLLSMTGLIAFGVVEVTAPSSGGDAAVEAKVAEPKTQLLLNVAIGRQGFYVSGAGGVLGADAAAPDQGRPPTIPLRAGKYDYEALQAELVKVKEQYKGEKSVILSADPDVEYDTLIQTMDACRSTRVQKPDGSTETRELFPKVGLAFNG